MKNKEVRFRILSVEFKQVDKVTGTSCRSFSNGYYYLRNNLLVVNVNNKLEHFTYFFELGDIKFLNYKEYFKTQSL